MLSANAALRPMTAVATRHVAGRPFGCDHCCTCYGGTGSIFSDGTALALSDAMPCSANKPTSLSRTAVRRGRIIVIWTSVAATLHCAANSAEPTAIDTIRLAAERAVTTQLGEASTERFVSAAALDSRLNLSNCAQPPAAAVMSNNADGSEYIVRVRCETPLSWALQLRVSVQSDSRVWVLTRSLARGSVPTPADLRSETRRVAGTTSRYVTDPVELNQRHLRQPTAAGTALRADMFERDIVIQRGQRVTLLAAASGIEIRAIGEALQDARVGERVRARNLTSLKLIEGVVDSSGEVRMLP